MAFRRTERRAGFVRVGGIGVMQRLVLGDGDDARGTVDGHREHDPPRGIRSIAGGPFAADD